MDSRSPAFERLAQILGCKWSLGILDAIDHGILRPGQIERNLDGIATTVLHRCIHRLEEEGFVVRHAYDEIPPRVEYQLSEDGQRLVDVIRQLQTLATERSELRPMEL